MSDERPAWADEKAHIEPYDPAWATRAEDYRRSLAAILGAEVEHVGSTSVPGLAAKPVIDLMSPAGDLDDLPLAALAGAGWCYVPPELDGQPYRRFFVLPDATGRHRLAHLHIIREGNPRWREQQLFRDRLRADPALRGAYATLKRSLIEAHQGEREAYTRAKADFIRAALAAHS